MHVAQLVFMKADAHWQPAGSLLDEEDTE